MSTRTLRAPPAAQEALEARWRDLEKELAEENRRREEVRAAAAERAKAAQLAPEPQPVARPATDWPALRAPVPVLIWIAELPVVLPDPMLTDAGFELLRKARGAIERRFAKKPGEARRLAWLLEQALGVTMDHRAAAWAPMRALIEDAGSPETAACLRLLAGKRGWRPKLPPEIDPVKEATKKAAKRKKDRDATFSDKPTDERRAKSVFGEEVKVSVSTEPTKGESAWNEDALKPKTTVVGRAQRDIGQTPEARLSRFTGLTEAHIRAGCRLAADWEKAGLEPRMTANLLATGGGSATDAWATGKSHSTMQARDRLHLAIQALNLGGLEVVHVVESVALKGESAVRAASATYSDKSRASTYVATTLRMGLNLLVQHYKISDEKAAAKRASRETA